MIAYTRLGRSIAGPGERPARVSAIDVVTLLAELCTLSGELSILGLTLWLPFTLTRHEKLHEAPRPTAEGSSSRS